MVSSIGPEKVSDDDLQKLENFVVLMYDRSSAASCVNEARLDQRTYDAIPPTIAALREHAKRAASPQSYGVRRLPQIRKPAHLLSADWGWIQSEEAWKINWTTLPPIAACCQDLTKCCCKKDCLKRCKCFRAGLSCTALCSCVCDQ